MPDTSPQSTGPRLAVVAGGTGAIGTGAIGGTIVRPLWERGPVVRVLDGAGDNSRDPSGAQDATGHGTPRPERERPSTVPILASLPTPHERSTRASSRRTRRDVLPHHDQSVPAADGTDSGTAAPPDTGMWDGPAAAAADPAELFALFHSVTMPFIDRLRAAAVQMTRDHRGAEALIEETYLRAFDSFGSLTWQTDTATWMFRLLAETAPDARGVRQSPVRSSSPTRRSVGRLPDAERPTSPVPRTAEAQAVGRLSGHAVRVALRRLPRKLAIVVHLADVEDFSYAEIAEILSIPPCTAKSRLHYGRRCLHGLLTDPARQRGLLFDTFDGSVEDSVASRWQVLGA
ncbi:RNA polymerase sigma factor [Streptomyces sp. NPDC002309]